MTTSTMDGRGGLTPDRVLELLESGTMMIPTDKDYKGYLEGYRKFYFYDWTTEQQDRFIALVNSKKIKFGVPGHLYKLPFFMKPK